MKNKNKTHKLTISATTKKDGQVGWRLHGVLQGGNAFRQDFATKR